MKIRGLLAITAAIAVNATVTPAHAGTVTSASLPAGSHPGSRERQYQVYVPSGLSTPAPMVMALHGCRQTQANALDEWGLKAAADQNRFILVTPSSPATTACATRTAGVSGSTSTNMKVLANRRIC